MPLQFVALWMTAHPSSNFPWIRAGGVDGCPPAARGSATCQLHASRALVSAAHTLHVRAYGQGVRPSVDRACQLARVLQDGVALELRHTAARDGGLRQQSAGAVAAARGRAALVFVTCAAANSGGLSGWMRASTAAQPAASRLHPPLTPPVFLRLPPPLESQARTAYGVLRLGATLHSLWIMFSRTANA